jgi:hypothetical protein
MNYTWNRIYLFVMLLAFNAVSTCSNLPEPYSSLTKVMPLRMHGWFMNATQLKKFIEQDRPKVVVELGSWMGVSTIYMANELRPYGGKLYAVDTWLGSVEHHREFSGMLPYLYEQFLSNCIHNKVTDIIIPVRMTTMQAAKELNVVPDLVYVDASHEEEDVYNDIKHWYAKLPVGGRMCGDDWSWPSVVRALKRISAELGVEIHAGANFWYFDPKS